MYGSHADAQTFATQRGFEGWPNDQSEGEALLLRASEALDGAYTFLGEKTDPEQDREWPRDCVRNTASATVPAKVNRATYRLALLLVSNVDNLTAVEVSQPIKSVQAGSVAVTYKDEAEPITARSLARHSEVSGYLRGLIIGSGNNVPLRRT